MISAGGAGVVREGFAEHRGALFEQAVIVEVGALAVDDVYSVAGDVL